MMTRDEAVEYQRLWGRLPDDWTEEGAVYEERRRVIAAWGARHAMCFGSCRHTTDRCDGG